MTQYNVTLKYTPKISVSGVKEDTVTKLFSGKDCNEAMETAIRECSAYMVLVGEHIRHTGRYSFEILDIDDGVVLAEVRVISVKEVK